MTAAVQVMLALSPAVSSMLEVVLTTGNGTSIGAINDQSNLNVLFQSKLVRLKSLSLFTKTLACTCPGITCLLLN